MTNMTKVYYAHPQSLYYTPQEARDVALLKSMGFEVVNPSDQKYVDQIAGMINSEDKMQFFVDLVNTCDILAFRSFPDGSIPAGVAQEIKQATSAVIELPSGVTRRTLSVEATREVLTELGQR